jgi:hypothetical protein
MRLHLPALSPNREWLSLANMLGAIPARLLRQSTFAETSAGTQGVLVNRSSYFGFVFGVISVELAETILHLCD